MRLTKLSAVPMHWSKSDGLQVIRLDYEDEYENF